MKQTSNPEPSGEGEQEEPKQEVILAKQGYSKEEVEKLIQARLEKEREKAEKERVQAEELAKLSGAERAEKELELKTKEFEAERRKFQLEKTELEVTKQLAEKGLPIGFAPMLIADDAEGSFENISKFEKSWQEALENAVKEKLKGRSPDSGSIKQGNESELGKRLAEMNRQSMTIQEDNPYFN